MIQYKPLIVILLVSLMLAVAFGAFGSHYLSSKLSDKYVDVFKTANFYHFTHSIGALVVLILLHQLDAQNIQTIMTIFIAGLILFSGSLYILSMHELWGMPMLKKLGAITPIGGLLFILGWAWSAYTVLKSIG